MMDSVGCSAFVARHASRGMVSSLSKRRNNAMGAEKPTRRALTGCPAPALQPLTREWAIAGVLRLVAKHPVNAELIITTLLEY
jgi:hypothetical protein